MEDLKRRHGARAEELFADQRRRIYRRTDRMFAVLMPLQWLAAVAAAVVVSPRTWAGAYSQTHLHVYAAVFLGGIVTLFPVYFAWRRPGAAATRYIVAAGQVLMSALLIHLSGGRIETHFHIFGSLAFLACYRDPRVLLPATLIVAADHFVRGIYWPQSVYGVLTASEWRWLEHAAWVLFEDAFLVLSIRQSLDEMRELAFSQAVLENANARIEEQVRERTRALREALANLQRTQEKLLLSEKLSAVGQLAAGVAHELNNPLGVILGFAQSAVRRIDKDGALALPLTSIEREAIRCKNLVQNLLTFSRQKKPGQEVFALKDELTAALSLVATQARVKGVELRSELAVDDLRLRGNANEIQQIVINLCSNAIDAMPEGGTLSVRARRGDAGGRAQAVLEVADTGTGIPEHVRGKVFEPFFTTKEPGKGTGLGLALIYEIVHRHAGAIDCASTIGQGTTFTVRLPAFQEARL